MPKYLQDSPKDLTLNIQEKHIIQGEKNQKGRCAAAACALDLPGVIGARIGTTTSTLILTTGKIIRFVNSKDLTERIRSFDKDQEFKAGAVKLLAVPASLTLGYISRRMAKRRACGYTLANKAYAATGRKSGHKINFRQKNDRKEAVKLERALFA